MNGIFISYRQDDAKPWALMLRDELVGAFGAEHVFLDKDTLQAGDWCTQIQLALASSKVVLVVMGPRWLTVTGGQGVRRLDDPDDVHRREVALALSTPGITVIPVRVDGAPMPRPEQLGTDIRTLTEKQSREIADASAHRALDMQLLIGDIERATGLVARRSTPGPALSKVRLVVVAAILGVVLLVVAHLSWTTPPNAVESAFLVLVALLLVWGSAWLTHRLRGRGK